MAETMKAAFLYSDKAKHIGIENVPKPACGPNDVLVRVNACAVCGTDGRIYEGTKDVTKGFVPQIRGYGEGKFILIPWQVGDHYEYKSGCHPSLCSHPSLSLLHGRLPFRASPRTIFRFHPCLLHLAACRRTL